MSLLRGLGPPNKRMKQTSRLAVRATMVYARNVMGAAVRAPARCLFAIR